jgi:hypothetical protein
VRERGREGEGGREGGREGERGKERGKGTGRIDRGVTGGAPGAAELDVSLIDGERQEAACRQGSEHH